MEDLAEDVTHVMTRAESEVDGCDSEIVRLVSLSDEYLVAHREVALDTFLAAVQASVDRRKA